ncbi:MAG: 50S ribosomal protein L6 [Candidatus Omnitrophota bacterium]
MSRIGKKPINIPKEAKIEIKEGSVFVEGPKGKINWLLPARIKVETKDGQVFVGRNTNTKIDRSLHGLTRALIANMFRGVTEGYTKELEIIGVGFKAQAQGNALNMHLGFSHPVNFSIPSGIEVTTPKPTQIIIRGIDKALVGEVSSEIRAIFPPEPYKGKGIRYTGEKVKKKIGKAQAATK